MKVQEAARAEAQDRRRREAHGPSLFAAEEMHSSTHYDQLRERYIARSRSVAQSLLEEKKRVLYDDLWDVALAQPMTWESDLKAWILGWTKEGRLKSEGWLPRQRVPHRDKENLLVWQ